MKLLIKSGKEIKDNEFKQIKEAYFREFKEELVEKKKIANHTFFLLIKKERILAFGGLIPVELVKFNKETFNILGVGGVISNQKGKGYGKKIVVAIKKYLLLKGKTGVGFCGLHNTGFYKKCGFKIDKGSIKRFVHYKDNKKALNASDDCVLYLDGSDNFMKKVLSNPGENIFLPRPPDW